MPGSASNGKNGNGESSSTIEDALLALSVSDDISVDDLNEMLSIMNSLHQIFTGNPVQISSIDIN